MKKIIAVASTIAFLSVAIPAFACEGYSCGGHHSRQQSSDITVSNTNSGTVTNNVTTSASTGYNDANGGDAKGQNATAGNGGFISTGDAVAVSEVTNLVNSNKTKISRDCGCKGDIDVTSSNSASVSNTLDTKAKTGGNDANGGDAKVKKSSNNESRYHHHSSNNGEANGGHGGEIWTGDALSSSAVVNVVNSNVTRIK